MIARRDDSLIDINSADAAALAQLPAVGKELAKRIIAGRPYEALEQLLQVQGLGARTLEQIRPFIHLEMGDGGDQPIDAAGPGLRKEDASFSGARPGFQDRMDAAIQNLIEGFQISRQVVWFVLVTAVITSFVSILLTLLLLAGLNRTLIFGRHATVKEMRLELAQVETTLDGLSDDLVSVDQRLQAVEGLSGRMATLESEFDLIQEEVDRAVVSVDQMSAQVTSISTEVEGMSKNVNLFAGFMEGLRLLLSDLFEPGETTTSP